MRRMTALAAGWATALMFAACANTAGTGTTGTHHAAARRERGGGESQSSAVPTARPIA
jgi:hypothetical protein